MQHPKAPGLANSPLLFQAIPWAILWIVVSGIEIAARFIHDPAIPVWQPVTLTAIPTVPMIVWLIVELKSVRYRQPPTEPPYPWFLYHLRRLPLLALGYVLLVAALRYALQVQSGIDAGYHGRLFYECIKVSLFYGLWLGLVYGTLSLSRAREQSAQLARMQQALVESQLARLQAQLRPHFLFNTLNTVSALMHSDVPRADRLLAQLGDLLRASLGAVQTNTVALAEEVRLSQLYSAIMEERFAGRATTEWQIAEDASCLPVPAMILQPLIENAFKHGVEHTTGRQHIVVAVTRAPHCLRIAIANSGSQLAPGWREGVGIANARQRLAVLYDGAASLDIVNLTAACVEASINLPLRGPS